MKPGSAPHLGHLALLACTVLLTPGGNAVAAALSTATTLSHDAHSLPDDLILPMPCGASMVFRPVDVAAGHDALADAPITTGRSDSDDGYNEYLTAGWVSGPFTVPSHPDLQRYYIGKYDVTRAQYAALTQTSCPVPTPEGRFPQAMISYDEARDFASRYSAWLLAHARASLPTRDGIAGFLRLPTDNEWSYAARGGLKVSAADFGAPTWPMPEGAEQYIAAGPDLGGVQPVGSLRPNPLGLYDVLGEVEQMILEPYRANRVGRLQGLPGGIATRGGNFLANPGDLTTSTHAEEKPFDLKTSQPTRLPTMGFRLVVSATALGTLTRTQVTQTDFDTIRKHAQEDSPDTHRLLQSLRDNAADPATRAGLDHIAAQLDADARARADARLEVLRAQLDALAALARTIWESDHVVTQLEIYVKSAGITQQADLESVKRNIARHHSEINSLLGSYINLLEAVIHQTENDHGRLDQAVSLENEALAQRDESKMIPFIKVAQQDASHATPRPGKTILDEIRTTQGEKD